MEERQEAWLVELRPSYSNVPAYFKLGTNESMHLTTTDPNKATKYSKEEAIAVAQALSFFSDTPEFHNSRLFATSHVFLSAID